MPFLWYQVISNKQYPNWPLKNFVHCLVRRKIFKISSRFLLLSRFFLCFDFLSYFLYLAFCYPLLYSQTTCDWKSYSFRSSYLFELPLDALVKMKTLSCVSSLSFFSSLYLSSVFLSRCYSSLVESSWLLWWLLVFFFNQFWSGFSCFFLFVCLFGWICIWKTWFWLLQFGVCNGMLALVLEIVSLFLWNEELEVDWEDFFFFSGKCFLVFVFGNELSF